MRLRLLPYFQNVFALLLQQLYIMFELSKNCPYPSEFPLPYLPRCQSHSITLLPEWQVCPWMASKTYLKYIAYTAYPLGLCVASTKEQESSTNETNAKKLSQTIQLIIVLFMWISLLAFIEISIWPRLPIVH